MIFVHDILNKNTFWENELRLVGQGRLFACFTPDSSVGIDGRTKPEAVATQSSSDNGLFVNHAYSVIKALDFEDPDTRKNRRFLRCEVIFE